MPDSQVLQEGQVLTGPLFKEPMRVESVRPNGADSWAVSLGTHYWLAVDELARPLLIREEPEKYQT